MKSALQVTLLCSKDTTVTYGETRHRSMGFAFPVIFSWRAGGVSPWFRICLESETSSSVSPDISSNVPIN